MRIELVLLATLSTDIKAVLKTHIRTAVATWVLSADSASLVIYFLVCFFLRVIGTGFEVEENRSIFIIKPMPCTLSVCLVLFYSPYPSLPLTTPCRSQFPDQGLNPGHSSESPEF